MRLGADRATLLEMVAVSKLAFIYGDKNKFWKWIIVLAVLAALAFGGFYIWKKTHFTPTEYRTAKISREG